MSKFAANLSMMFNEVPFLDRFAAAADCGFTAVEYLFPYNCPAELVAERLQAAGLAHGETGGTQLPFSRRIATAGYAPGVAQGFIAIRRD